METPINKGKIMIIYVGNELMNEGYDATVTLKTELFATEKLAKAWCDQIKSDDYIWRDYEPTILIEE